ncbi:MAG: leucyl-tRNA synthetase [uncultured bacterium]|nr:MAG: leucyl-tRNA synthetase [uncultured bacterium]
MVLSKEHLEMFASLLSLFAPKTAGEIVKSQSSDHSPKIAQGSELWLQWPDVRGIEGINQVMMTIAVQVNGKLRGTVEIKSQEAENQELVMDKVRQDERIGKWIVREPKKIIFVPGRLVNVVV